MKTSAGLRKVLESDFIFSEPFTVRLCRANFFFKFLVADNAALLKIYNEHFSGLQSSFGNDIRGINIKHADFAGHDHTVITCDNETRRA